MRPWPRGCVRSASRSSRCSRAATISRASRRARPAPSMRCSARPCRSTARPTAIPRRGARANAPSRRSRELRSARRFVSSEKRPGPSLGPDTPFGDKYVLIRHIATGGMAELYLARQSGLAGFEKELVIKRILPRYVEHTKVVKMFIDEARIAASLNHPNIVHIYDIGQQDGSWYIAMEYIHGENLWSIARRGIEAKNFLPIEHAVKIIDRKSVV